MKGGRSDVGKVDLDNGYTRIANELLEEIPKLGFNGTQLSILIVVIRYTYGFQRKEHKLSLTFLAKATKKHKMHIQKELKNLIEMNVLTELAVPTFSGSRIVGLNKDVNSWELVKTLTVSEIDSVSQDGNTTVSELTNSTVSELTNQERKKENFKETVPDFHPPAGTKKHYDEYFEKIWAAYPNKKGKSSVSAKQKLKLYNEVPEEQMLQAIDKYKQETKGFELRFIKHGSTWFNGGYEDYIEVVKTPPAPKKEPVYRDYQEKMAELEAAELERLMTKPKIQIVPYDEAESRREKHDYNQRT